MTKQEQNPKKKTRHELLREFIKQSPHEDKKSLEEVIRKYLEKQYARE